MVAGHQMETELGPFQVKGQGAIDPLQGKGGLGGGLQGELFDRKVSAGAKGGLDVDAGGRPEAIAAGVKAGYDGIGVSGGAGIERRVSEPRRLPDGSWRVTFQRGLGGSSGLSLPEGGIQAKLGGGEVQTRSFQSEDDAKRWAAALDDERSGADMLTTSDVLAMQPGESATVDRAILAGGGYDVTTPAAPKVGLGARYDSKQTYEKLDESTLKVTNAGGWSVDGEAGVTAWALGYVGSLGTGGDHGVDAEFDLDQPGAVEALEHFQRWGSLPDPLPAGVTVSENKDVQVDTWGHESLLGTETLTTQARTESGTLMRDGVQGDYAKGTRKETQERYAVFGSLPISKESHEVEAFAPEDGPSQLRTRSDYAGQGSKAQVQDDLAVGDIQKARDAYGYEDGVYTVETHYTSDDYGGLEDLSVRAAREKYGDLFTEFEERHGGRGVKDADLLTDEHDQVRCFQDLVDGLAGEDIDLGAVAECVASGGGEAVEMLRYNTQYETTHVGSPGSEALQGRQGYDAIETQLTAMGAADVPAQDKERLVERIVERISALDADRESPQKAIQIERKHLLDQLRRAQYL